MLLDRITTVPKPIDITLSIKKQNPTDKIIALAGNPNVGKSTVLVVGVIWNDMLWSGF